MRPTLVVPTLLACAGCLPALDVVTITAQNPVTPESSAASSPLRFRVQRTGGTGAQDVTVRLAGSAILVQDFALTGQRAGFSVETIRVLSGGDYTTPPAVTISRAPGDTVGAGATAVSVLGVGPDVNVIAAGAYSAYPSLSVVGGGGTGAGIIPVMSLADIRAATKSTSVPNGVYTDLPANDPSQGGRAARATIIVSGSDAQLNITDLGSGYAIGETVTFTFSDGTVEDSMEGIALYGIDSVARLASGRGFTSVPTIGITAASATEFAPASVAATLEVVDITVTNQGSGYTTPPLVAIGAGSVTATAVTAGFLTTVRILDGQRETHLVASPVSDNDIELSETVRLDVVAGSGYIVGSQNSTFGTIADDDITTTWTMIDPSAEESLSGLASDESTVSVSFTGNPLSARPISEFSRLIQIQPQQGGAVLGSDHVMTIMFRHPGQPVGKTMQELRTTNQDFTQGWKVAQNASLEDGDTDIPYNAGPGILSTGDVIQFGDDNTNLYRVTGIGGSSISISPGLVVGVSDGALIRNNISVQISSDGDIQGVTTRPSDTAIDFTITPIYDNQPEGAESVSLRLLGSNDYRLADPQVMDVQIGDDDLIVDMELGSNAGEPSSQGSAIITLSAPLAKDIVIPYQVGGTAVAGEDYDALPGSITVPAGTVRIPIPVIPRLDGDSDVESVTISLIDTPDYQLRGSAFGQAAPAATVNILDSAGVISVQVQDGDAREAENDSAANPGRFRVVIAGARGVGSAAVSVLYDVTGSATPGADFRNMTGQVTIPSGQSSADVVLTVEDDQVVEGSESVTLTVVSSAGYGVSATGSTATIQIEDDEPTMAISPVASTAEPAGTTQVRIGYAGPALNRSFSVPYSLGGSAVAGRDYAGLSGTASIPAGQSQSTVDLSVIDDVDAEGPETVVITLQSRAEYALDPAGTVASLEIADDEPVVSVAMASAGIEGGSPTLLTVSLDRTLPRNLPVSYTISGGSAVAGTDYVMPYAGAQGSVTVIAGQSSVSLPVAALNDAIVEGDETFIVTLQPAGTYTVASASAAVAGVIQDDEPTVEVVASVANAAEPAVAGQFTIRNTGAARSTPLIIAYTVSGTATSGSDFQPLPGTAVIPANQSAVIVPLTPIDDTAVESSESVVVTLTAAGDGSYGLASASSARVVIADDDVPPTPGKPPTGSSSGGGGGCGLGSGLAALLGALAMALRLGLRRRR